MLEAIFNYIHLFGAFTVLVSVLSFYILNAFYYKSVAVSVLRFFQCGAE